MVGGKHWQVLVVEGVAPGSHVLNLQHVRPFDPASDKVDFHVTVVVN